jgi:hypothetical protein
MMLDEQDEFIQQIMVNRDVAVVVAVGPMIHTGISRGI